MTSITDKLEGLLPADGNYTTKDERVIAEAVAELRQYDADGEFWINIATEHARDLAAEWQANYNWLHIALAFAAGCIASAIYVVLV